MKEAIKKFKEFGITSWAVEHRTTVYIFSFVIILAGVMVYNSLPKEQFPDIVIPNIYVSTIYPGTSPEDMETLITKQIEKELKSVTGVKKVTSTSIADFSAVLVEFNAGINVPVAKQRVVDAVDRAKNELPEDLDRDPQVQEVEFSEFPIMNLNLSGEFSLKNLKKYAEDLEDAIEELPQIKRVDIIGALNREIQINVDLFKAEAAGITFGNIEQAVASENVNISGGEINLDNVRRTLRVTGEIKTIDALRNIVVRGSRGQSFFLKDIAEIRDGFEEKQDFARLDGKPVISLNVIKRGGENLILAAEGIDGIITKLEKSKFPEGLKIVRTGDQSERTRHDLEDLINTVVLGFIFVVLVLMFFMGTTDAIFVGLSVPLSALVAFIPLLFLGFTLNIIVMFAFLLGLGIVVDDAIVVIENTHRLFNQERLPIKVAAKKAAGEVFYPVLSGTLVNVAPFAPLVFWPGLVGEFMRYLPITLILTLFGSLFVAFFINPVFAVSFMKRHGEGNKGKENRRFWIVAAVLAVLTALGFVISGAQGTKTLGTLFGTMLFLQLLNRYILGPMIRGFQQTVVPGIEHNYKRLIEFVIPRRRSADLHTDKMSWLGKAGLRMAYNLRPLWFVLGTFALLVVTLVLYGGSNPKVGFFPQGEPNYVYVYVEMPIGTDGTITDSIMSTVFTTANDVLKPHRGIVKSVITNVGIGAGDPQSPDRVVAPHKGKLTVAFVPLSERIGISTKVILNQVRERIGAIPGAIISVQKESNGPPTGLPISIEITGDDLKILLKLQNDIKAEIARQGIKGIDQLKSDLELNKPEIIVDVDREKASREGISTAQVALALRTSLFGKEISQYREAKDEYPIMLRLDNSYRTRLDALINQKIDFRDMATGQYKKIPISSVATVKYATTYSAIKRKNQERIVTLSSDVVPGANANEINELLETKVFPAMALPDGYAVRLGGAQEQQAETSAFLGLAGISALIIMLLILVTQFNSLSKPLVTFATIAFSLIGVFGGFMFSGMEFSIVMSGVGILALAGIVVKNGIILVEFIEELRSRGQNLHDAVVNGGATRMTPVLLTAAAATLGLVPLAIGMNINFGSLLAHWDPEFYIGGESSVFWGPLAWTIIFGLVVSTFLTLIIAPAMYYLVERFRDKYMGGRKPTSLIEDPSLELETPKSPIIGH